jgi:succinate dehydrogenase flavin-adding protein (antitoxin of CptAB toxin-antitoxin module)
MAPALDSTRLARIRWRCRRGMLENDLVLERFLALRGAALREDEVAMLDALLDLPDTKLWELVAGLAEPEDPAVAPLVAVLRETSPLPPNPCRREPPR